jgi:cobalt-zinc-cadmium efflux system outer membrane protein
MDFLVRGCLWAALALAAGAAFSQDPTVTWGEALEAGWRRAVERAEGARQLQRAEAERSAAESRWAAPPSVELSHRSGRSPGDGGSVRETEAGLAWPLWLPGQRQSRLGAAEAEIEAARLALDAARLRLAGELRQGALAVAAQAAELRQAELETRLLKALAEDIERRLRAGDLARADLMAAQAELLQAQAHQQGAAQRWQVARDRWQLLTGLDALPPAEAAAAATAAPSQHPELAAAAARVEGARRRLQAAERFRREPPEVGVSVRRETENAGSATSVGVSLRVPLGGDRLNAPALAQARGELELAQLEEERTRERLALETRAADLQVRSAGQQLQAERSRAALLRERAELIERSFRAGETALPELLRALGAAAQADAAVLRQQAALAQAQARLSQSLGVLP